jgi:3-phytase
VAAPSGAVVAFGLDGRTRQTIAGIDRPNNIDVEYGVVVGGRTMDIAVVTERLQHRLRVFEIEPAEGRLVEHARVPVLAGEAGERAEPMGIALYVRPSDRALFAIVAPKTGSATGYLAQYRLADDGRGTLGATLVRRFGAFSDRRDTGGELGEIEAVVVDDELGFVYYADELHGIRKGYADPDHPDADRELAVFGTSGYVADREGLAIYPTGPGTGFVISTDQIDGGSVLKFYPREGRAGTPHDHGLPLFEVQTPSDATDGIEAVHATFPGFPDGLIVMMNSAPRNFLVFDWRDIRR